MVSKKKMDVVSEWKHAKRTLRMLPRCGTRAQFVDYEIFIQTDKHKEKELKKNICTTIIFTALQRTDGIRYRF